MINISMDCFEFLMKVESVNSDCQRYYKWKTRVTCKNKGVKVWKINSVVFTFQYNCWGHFRRAKADDEKCKLQSAERQQRKKCLHH